MTILLPATEASREYGYCREAVRYCIIFPMAAAAAAAAAAVLRCRAAEQIIQNRKDLKGMEKDKFFFVERRMIDRLITHLVGDS